MVAAGVTTAAFGKWGGWDNWDGDMEIPESFAAAVLTWCCFFCVMFICDLPGGTLWMDVPAFYGI